MVHGAPGHLNQGTRRRALATRGLGEETRWDEHLPHVSQVMREMGPSFP
ncbi:hypothetical protein QOZ94_003981 [Xanthobacter agilis]|jgi:hypothetical protein|uniref:Uncharacterized protein n=1 Tax=Xanthobacter agilis TaxID=47492 RepID=A0ABU0LJ76_XANAG|nr:hypothetical protein [Xanthobacter agilis]